METSHNGLRCQHTFGRDEGWGSRAWNDFSKPGLSAGLERAMSKTVDRIMKAIALKRPMTAEQTQAIRKEVTRFADELLEKYKHRLSDAR
jgi:hypothetical protein